MKLFFITFGSHNHYKNAAVRLARQAQSFNLFTNIIAYTGDYLKSDIFFWNQHGDFINTHSRGFGYWLWKPYLIKKTMNQLEDGDILLYLDCGCELDIREKEHLHYYMEAVKKEKLIGCDTYCMEQMWNKQDLMDTLNMNENKHMLSSQREAGALLILVCEETRDLVNQWYELGCTYHNIDDSPSISSNFIGFKEHRHDQSIFSLLAKKYNLVSAINLKDHCIKYIRNRTGYSQLTGS